MQVFKCDICGKETWINPPSKPKMKEVKVKRPTKVVDGKVVEEEVILESRPILTKMRRQNICTGDIEEIEVNELEDLKPRTVLIQLHASMESIKKDFCQECYKKSYVKIAVDNLWLELEKIKSF